MRSFLLVAVLAGVYSFALGGCATLDANEALSNARLALSYAQNEAALLQAELETATDNEEAAALALKLAEVQEDIGTLKEQTEQEPEDLWRQLAGSAGGTGGVIGLIALYLWNRKRKGNGA